MMRMMEVGEGWRPGVPGNVSNHLSMALEAMDHAVVDGSDCRHY